MRFGLRIALYDKSFGDLMDIASLKQKNLARACELLLVSILSLSAWHGLVH